MNKFNYFSTAIPLSAATNSFGILAKHDMNMKRSLTINAFRIYSITNREIYFTPGVDFLDVSTRLKQPGLKGAWPKEKKNGELF
jgi:hypothetical protein